MGSIQHFCWNIIFYEELKGHSYEWTSDCSDMAPFLARCHSCRVESGCWMVYDRPNFMGNQYFVRRGEYADYMSMWGMRISPKTTLSTPFPQQTRIYGRENFMGQMMEIMVDCDPVTEHYHWSSGFMSCHVLDGLWPMYKLPHYRGRMWYFWPVEYRLFRHWGGRRFMGKRCIMDSWY
uniref:Beta/gamma crystallin 'Greek key' domain-containing protein n=1 Tax=Electrophorus electricus TaxID=8005 RepID=A0A4W4GAJ6_ELEEL